MDNAIIDPNVLFTDEFGSKTYNKFPANSFDNKFQGFIKLGE